MKGGPEYKIICDTREQLPLWEDDEVVRAGLKTGDYSILGYENFVSIERKSLPDLFGTLGSGHLRFKKELERALKLKYFAIVIEGTLTDVLNKAYSGSNYSQMKGETIAKILATLSVKYGIHIYYTNGRKESKAIIRLLFDSFIKTYKKS
jgi:DNA excision repair protein ERCC-4